MRDADVIIVGAGLTGLRAALDLLHAGLSVLVVERASSVGGRMRTTRREGFLLDHGFQVIPAAYPELSLIPDLESLGLRAFASGARVRWNGSFHDFFDPRRHPSRIFDLLSSKLVTLPDLIRFFLYASLYSRQHPRHTNETTAASLKRFGFSANCAERFLKPFLAGILLDPTHSLDASLARFYLRVFSDGQAMLPVAGIQALPELLAHKVGLSHILLNSSVESVSAREVVLASGESLICQRVVVCCDAIDAAHLGSPDQTMPQNCSRTMYFAAQEAPHTEAVVALNGEGRGLICNIAVPSVVQPSYAPPGSHLVAVTLVGDGARCSDEHALLEAQRELREWYGEKVLGWRHLTTFTIPRSVPARPRLELGVREHNGVVFAGDYLSYGSQNGALRAGREAARLIAEATNAGNDEGLLSGAL